MTLDRYLTNRSDMRVSEEELWAVVKGVWKELKFSCIHHSITKEESTTEYYQSIFGFIFLVSSYQLVSRPPHYLGDDIFAALTLMVLYLVI